MLTEELKQLISAVLDGELTPDEIREVRELLWTSAEARALYGQLKADRDRLRGLIPVAPPADLRVRIMSRLPGLDPRPTPAGAGQPHTGRSRVWIPVGLAASLLIGMTGASFWFFSQGNSNGTGDSASVAPGESPANGAGGAAGWDRVLPREQAVLPPAPPVIAPPREAVANSSDPIIDVIPPPRSVDSPPRDALTFPPVPPLDPFELAQVRIPFLASVSELGRDDVGQALMDDLEFHPAVRIDLFSNDPGRGVELFRAAAKTQGLTLYSEPGVAERIKRKQGTAYLVYLECLTPSEIRALLAGLGGADAKSKPRVFDTLHLSPAGAPEVKELKEVLGVDPGLWKRPQPGLKGEAPDPKKPISTGTADEVARNLAAPAKPVPKPAVLLTLSPELARIHPAVSAELKKYLGQRGVRKDTAVPAMIVIR